MTDAAVGVLGDETHVVGDEHDRRTGVREAAQQPHQALRLLIVLSERRLVEHDDVGLADHHAGDRQPPLLSLAQHVRAASRRSHSRTLAGTSSTRRSTSSSVSPSACTPWAISSYTVLRMNCFSGTWKM